MMKNEWVKPVPLIIAVAMLGITSITEGGSEHAPDFHVVSADRQDAIWREFETARRGVSNFVAEVVQTKTLKILQQPIVSEAKLSFAKPNLFRWESTKPAGSLTVSDGKWLWMYYAEFQQAERYPLNDPRLGASPMKALSASLGANPVSLTNSCELIVWESAETLRIEAVPRAQKERQLLARLVLDLDRKTFLLLRTVIEAPNGDRTENRFQRVEWNQPLDVSRFRFEPPAGVRIVSPFGK